MMTKEKAREITNKVIAEKDEKITKDARNYVNTIVDVAIMESANKGHSCVIINIPSTIDCNRAIDCIKEHGFEVKGNCGYNEYKISW